jgi:hypothetical protein
MAQNHGGQRHELVRAAFDQRIPGGVQRSGANDGNKNGGRHGGSFVGVGISLGCGYESPQWCNSGLSRPRRHWVLQSQPDGSVGEGITHALQLCLETSD